MLRAYAAQQIKKEFAEYDKTGDELLKKFITDLKPLIQNASVYKILLNNIIREINVHYFK